MPLCPSGHTSASDDYCDVCGLPIGEQPPASTTPPPAAAPEPAGTGGSGGSAGATETTCPNCAAVNPENALFCEACGYDFTTGQAPRPVTPSVLDLGIPADDPADVAADSPPVDPQTAETPAVPGPPESIAPPLADAWVAEIWIDPDWYADQDSSDPLPSAGVPTVVPLRTTSILVGRTSRSRNIHPDIDLATDNGISRRHCQLTTDGTRWWVEDLGSSNGTYLGSPIGPLPTVPLLSGEKREIGPDGRLYLGAWTRIVIRRAAPGEL